MRTLGLLLLAAVLAGGCGAFDRKHGHGGGTGDDRCDVDLDQWKRRVRSFKGSERHNRDSFQKVQDDLVHDLRGLDTRACRREIQRQVDDLVDEVRSERF